MKIIGKALEKAVLKKLKKNILFTPFLERVFNLRSIKNKSVEVSETPSSEK